MDNLTFVKFTLEHYSLYETWCEDAEINRWIGNATQEWLDYVVTTFDSFTWMIYENDVPVAHLQIDMFGDDKTHAQVTIMVAPQLRRKGYGRQVLSDMLHQAELTNITHFYAYIKPENSVSVELFTVMGYKPASEPSDTGYVDYVFLRT